MEDDSRLVTLQAEACVLLDVKDVLAGVDLQKNFTDKVFNKKEGCYDDVANTFTTAICDYLLEPFDYKLSKSLFDHSFEDLLTDKQKETLEPDDIKDTLIRMIENRGYLKMLFDKGYLQIETDPDKVRMYGFNKIRSEENTIRIGTKIYFPIDKMCVIEYEKFLKEAKKYLDERDNLDKVKDMDEYER